MSRAELIVVRDPVRGGREVVALEPGANVGGELMRLFPLGLGPFDIYRGEARADCVLKKTELCDEYILAGERYVLVVRPGAIALPIWYLVASIVVSIAVSVIAKALMPKPKQAESNANTEAISPNNALAGQTNLLRPGARVPEILGKMRCYPDLIVNAAESWIGRSQWIVEWFVLGVGTYKIENARLGETALHGLTGAQLITYNPGDTVPAILCVKRSPLVDNLSLLTETPTASAAQTTFTPPGSMSSALFVPISLGVGARTPVRIGNTTYNNALFDVTMVPRPDQTEPPFLYSLDGPVRAEVAEDAIVRPAAEILFIQYTPLSWLSSGDGSIVIPLAQGYVPTLGQIVRLYFLRGANYIGTVVWFTYEVGPSGGQYRFLLNDFRGNRIVIPPAATVGSDPALIVYDDSGDIYTGVAGELPQAGEVISLERARTFIGPRADQMFTVWTDWQTAPFANPQQLLVDIAFPQGLVWYNKGDRKPYTVQVEAEFKRLDAPAAQARLTWTYTNSTQGALRYTQRVVVGGLGLPAGSPYVQTRVRRVTPWKQDDNENQYIADTRWQAYAAATELPPQTYGNVTLLKLTLWNTRAASSIGETSLNVIATRLLPMWTGNQWSTPAPSERWADALVARMKATDGANKRDLDIDVAGIYAIQSRLDAQDGGEQGKIALTLDQQQDIDAELTTIASIVRCQLYRVGPKLYVERDEGGKTAIALFTGRSKHPDAETVSVTLAHDADPDAVIVPWWDRSLDAWKQREFQFPADITPVNPLRIAPAQATWAQAYRRALYEWNRLTLRRETIALKATEEATLVHPGDVINIADDVGNLSQTAGEIIEVLGDATFRLDQSLDLAAGGYLLLVRSLDGRATDVIAVSQQLGPADVRLERPPRFAVKGRDDALGSMFALYRSDARAVIPWLVASIEPEERYVAINAMNWTEAVFAGDYAPLPGMPISPYLATLHLAQPQTIGTLAEGEQ